MPSAYHVSRLVVFLLQCCFFPDKYRINYIEKSICTVFLIIRGEFYYMNHFKDSICLNRYSYDVWKKINPEYGYDEWKSFNVPDSVSEFITVRLFELSEYIPEAMDLKKYCIITIDEDYLSWLNGREHTLELLQIYTAQIPVKELNSKFLNSGMNRDLYIQHIVLKIP